MRKIYIVVEGGVVSEAYANTPVELEVIDLDTDFNFEDARVRVEYDKMKDTVSNSMWIQLY